MKYPLNIINRQRFVTNISKFYSSFNRMNELLIYKKISDIKKKIITLIFKQKSKKPIFTLVK